MVCRNAFERERHVDEPFALNNVVNVTRVTFWFCFVEWRRCSSLFSVFASNPRKTTLLFGCRCFQVFRWKRNMVLSPDSNTQCWTAAVITFVYYNPCASGPCPSVSVPRLLNITGTSGRQVGTRYLYTETLTPRTYFAYGLRSECVPESVRIMIYTTTRGRRHTVHIFITFRFIY